MERLLLKIFVRHSLLVGGQTSSPLADVATAREPGGAPIIPASALKGAIRIEFERLARCAGERICNPSSPAEACEPNSPCIACRLFGSPGKEGKLRFHDARLEEARGLFTDEGRPKVLPARPTGKGYDIRPGVAIGRIRKVAEEKLLFASETIAPFPDRLTFCAEVDVFGTLDDREWGLIQGAVLNLRAIGADKSRGLGHIEACIERVPHPDVPAQAPPPDGDLIITLVPLEYVRVSGVKPTNNFLQALGFLPGSAVRGAVARSFSSSHGGWKDPAVRKAFVGNPALFSDFYPNSIGRPAVPKPVPLSARTCKDFPGFSQRAPTAEERGSHGAKDILIVSTVIKLLREKGLPVAFEDSCEKCGAALRPLEGFYFYPLERASEEMPRRASTKTAINRVRLTSAEGQLYSYEFLDPGLECSEQLVSGKMRIRFTGVVRNLTSELREFLCPGRVLLIGGARSRGFGKVKIEMVNEVQEEDEKKWKDHLCRFTELVHAPFKDVGYHTERLFFSITLMSDLVLPPGGGLEWFKGEVAHALNLSDLRLERAFVRTGYRGGFNDALGVQKDLLPVLVRGSAFAFSCEEDGERKILGGLPSLLREGLGWRREEGFGMVSFCDPFHLERINWR